MVRRSRTSLPFLMTLVVSLVAVLTGSRSVRAQGRTSFDVTVGGRHNSGLNGDYTCCSPVLEGTLAFRPSPRAERPTPTFALSAGMPFFRGTRVLCLDVGDCQRRIFPAVSHVGLLVGLERSISFTSVRASAGPAWFGGDGASGLGGQLQLDLAAGGSHVAFVATARGGLDARFSGETLRLASFGLGVRVR